MRLAAIALGAGATLFGLLPAIAPGPFGRMFGIGAAAEPSVATAIRSVGVRDMVTGIGLLRAAASNDDATLRQWLLARVACDTGDMVAVGLALAAGERNPRFVGLGALAAGAAAFGAVVLRRVR